MKGILIKVVGIAGVAVYMLGGLLMLGLFFYGVYALFAKTLLIGFSCIGAAVVGSWLVHILFSLLCAFGSWLNKDNQTDEEDH